MTAASTKPIGIQIDQETHDRVKRLAQLRQRTPHCLLQEAIAQYLDREERREAVRQQAVGAWTEYQTSGMHVDASEVTAWLETWGEENELPAPTCHK
ncbi:CopG family ribbon-helix-helix protein [Rugamonas sp. CCM 8940]|uniref:CopG family ribbon-helix-helix protein n=1 Tax=Rugamonas sp. CCM 8940 TaxID=2765359 RepID=UPI0018F45807|nr:CopG family transcriptional regulator [Rugamonas sp. CCM 8940]MBJ7311529.1 CopG family transcriptional regulator [Rugamonas sp. CCM 8940]